MAVVVNRVTESLLITPSALYYRLFGGYTLASTKLRCSQTLENYFDPTGNFTSAPLFIFYGQNTYNLATINVNGKHKIKQYTHILYIFKYFFQYIYFTFIWLSHQILTSKNAQSKLTTRSGFDDCSTWTDLNGPKNVFHLIIDNSSWIYKIPFWLGPSVQLLFQVFS